MAVPLGALATIAQNLLFERDRAGRAHGRRRRATRSSARSPRRCSAPSRRWSPRCSSTRRAPRRSTGSTKASQPDALDAYRGIIPACSRSPGRRCASTIVAGLLVVTVIGIPFAIVYLIRKTMTLAVDRDRGARSHVRPEAQRRAGARQRTARLRDRRLVNGTVALLGPIIGVAMMFITPASLGFINLVAALVYVFVLPAAGIIDRAALLRPAYRQGGRAGACRGGTPRDQPAHRQPWRNGHEPHATGRLVGTHDSRARLRTRVRSRAAFSRSIASLLTPC